MTKDEALKMALEALETVKSYEVVDYDPLAEAIDAIRQALAEPPPDQLPDTTQMIDKVCIRHWVQDTVENHLDAVYQRNDHAFLAQAQLGQPDATKWLDEIRGDEPDTGIDRGAWSDVPNATKWVDELRGDEPSTNAEPIGEIVEAHGLIAVSIPEMPPVGTKLYAQPLLNQTCCGCGRSGGYALYCGWCWNKGDVPVGYVDQSDLDREGHDFWVSRQEGTRTVPLYTAPPKREWQGLTEHEKDDIHRAVAYSGNMTPWRYANEVLEAANAKLKEKNT